MYGSNAELEERGIDPTQLLKLIKTEEEFEDDELAYSDAEDRDDSKRTNYIPQCSVCLTITEV